MFGPKLFCQILIIGFPHFSNTIGGEGASALFVVGASALFVVGASAPDLFFYERK